MAADRVNSENHVPEHDREDWIRRNVVQMRDEHGCTFFRASHDPRSPDWLYLEGWKVPPADQGPHPWEAAKRLADERNFFRRR